MLYFCAFLKQLQIQLYTEIRRDHKKKVELNVDCKHHLIQVQITDEGEGFDIEDIPDPTHKENILKETGRGIHIIKSISAKCKF